MDLVGRVVVLAAAAVVVVAVAGRAYIVAFDVAGTCRVVLLQSTGD